MADLIQTIEEAFENRAELRPDAVPEAVRDAVAEAIDRLNSGADRVAFKEDGAWRVNEWLKKAVLLYFRTRDNRILEGAFKIGRAHV